MPTEDDRLFDPNDRWLRALRELPRPELSPSRQAQMLSTMQRAMETSGEVRTDLWYRVVEWWIEPVLLALSACVVLVRLCLALALYLGYHG